MNNKEQLETFKKDIPSLFSLIKDVRECPVKRNDNFDYTSYMKLIQTLENTLHSYSNLIDISNELEISIKFDDIIKNGIDLEVGEAHKLMKTHEKINTLDIYRCLNKIYLELLKIDRDFDYYYKRNHNRNECRLPQYKYKQ